MQQTVNLSYLGGGVRFFLPQLVLLVVYVVGEAAAEHLHQLQESAELGEYRGSCDPQHIEHLHRASLHLDQQHLQHMQQCVKVSFFVDWLPLLDH